MVFSIPGMSGITRTSGYRLVSRGGNDEREQSDNYDISSNTKPPHWSNPIGLRLALILLVLSFLFNIIHLYKSHSAKPNPYFIPDIPYTTDPVIFNQDNRWVGASPSVDKQWDQHVNNALLGYISIPNPKAYNLQPGVDYNTNRTEEIFSISWYHQLHCLAMIRHAYYHPLDAHIHDHGQGHASRSPASEAAQRAAHLDHCFDYLRQAITCAADMTVEWAKVEFDGTRRQVDGWGIPHAQCRDPDAVEAFMREHRLS